MSENMKLTYSSSVSDLCEVNSSFDRGVLRIAYVGDNRNGSSISKESFERAIPTIFNCPVVCNYNRELDQIGSHDSEVVMSDGIPKIVNLTTPVGVIPESSNVWFETIEDNGIEREYLCAEALIWKRQEAYDHIKDNGIVDESMEIAVKAGHSRDDKFYQIEDFEFNAFCLLGGNAAPCYEGASLEMFSLESFKAQYAQMMEDLKEQFYTASEPNDINKEGGEKHLDEKINLLEQFGMTAEQLDFDLNDVTVEELEQKLNEQFALTAQQLTGELCESLSEEKITDECGFTYSRYCYYDHDTELGEVYCWDWADWKLYGFTYTMNGDHAVIDFECKKRKKFVIADFDEGAEDVSMKEMFSVPVEAAVNAKAVELTKQFDDEKVALNEKFENAEATITEQNKELDELREFQQTKLKEERDAAESAVFAMFEDLNGVEAFESLRSDCGDMTIEELEEKCYALRGRNTTHKFSAVEPKAPRLPIERKTDKADSPYGDLFEKYPPRH